MNKKTKKTIEKILENFRVERGELEEMLSETYENKNSRMPEFITRKINPFPLKSSDIKDKLWINFGIPHQIFLNLDKYIFDKEEGETDPIHKASA